MIKLGVNAEIEHIDSTSLEAMNKAVGGPIQLLASKDDMTVYCNESGMLEGLNPSAYIPDFLLYMGFKGAVEHQNMVFGNVVISRDDKKLTSKQKRSIKIANTYWRQEMEKEDEEEEEDDGNQQEIEEIANSIFSWRKEKALMYAEDDHDHEKILEMFRLNGPEIYKEAIEEAKERINLAEEREAQEWEGFWYHDPRSCDKDEEEEEAEEKEETEEKEEEQSSSPPTKKKKQK